MNTVKAFLKKYWITCCIFIGLVALYIFLTSNGLVNPYLFPSTDKIKAAVIDSKDMMFGNAVASFKLLIPSILLSLLIALFLGTIMGLNQRVREILHPVIYAFSVVPSILLSPFVLLLAPTLFSASVFLIVYNIVWATLFATITGIMTIDKVFLDKAKTLELNPVEKMFQVILPAAMPSIMSGFINSLRGSFVVLVYAEMYGAKYGMGYYVKKFAEYGLYSEAWSGFIFMVVVLVIVMQLFEKVKNRILRWTLNYQKMMEARR